ncbi:unnamed protein product [Closterium sp. NIES-54]
MGEPILAAALIPTTLPATTADGAVVKAPLQVDGVTWQVTCVSMGNPHCITFSNSDCPQGLDVAGIDLHRIGPMFEHHHAFPARTNTGLTILPLVLHLPLLPASSASLAPRCASASLSSIPRPHFPIQPHPLFPIHPLSPVPMVASEFVEVISRNELRMRVWERGAGEPPHPRHLLLPSHPCPAAAAAAATATALPLLLLLLALPSLRHLPP